VAYEDGILLRIIKTFEPSCICKIPTVRFNFGAIANPSSIVDSPISSISMTIAVWIRILRVSYSQKAWKCKRQPFRESCLWIKWFHQYQSEYIEVLFLKDLTVKKSLNSKW
jgi:hypothetical protein